MSRLQKIRGIWTDDRLMALPGVSKASSVGKLTADDVFLAAVSIDPTPVGKYVSWLLTAWENGGFQWEDISHGAISETMFLFHQHYRKIADPKKRAINAYGTPGQLYMAIADFIDVSGSREIKRLDAFKASCERWEKTYPSGLKVTVPLTCYASSFYGLGTRWCTTNGEMFNEYNRHGNLAILTLPDHQRFQMHIHLPSGQIDIKNVVDDDLSQDEENALLAYRSDIDSIVSMLSQSVPGLGDKINHDPNHFLNQSVHRQKASENRRTVVTYPQMKFGETPHIYITDDFVADMKAIGVHVSATGEIDASISSIHDFHEFMRILTRAMVHNFYVIEKDGKLDFNTTIISIRNMEFSPDVNIADLIVSIDYRKMFEQWNIESRFKNYCTDWMQKLIDRLAIIRMIPKFPQSAGRQIDRLNRQQDNFNTLRSDVFFRPPYERFFKVSHQMLVAICNDVSASDFLTIIQFMNVKIKGLRVAADIGNNALFDMILEHVNTEHGGLYDVITCCEIRISKNPSSIKWFCDLIERIKMTDIGSQIDDDEIECTSSRVVNGDSIRTVSDFSLFSLLMATHLSNRSRRRIVCNALKKHNVFSARNMLASMKHAEAAQFFSNPMLIDAMNFLVDDGKISHALTEYSRMIRGTDTHTDAEMCVESASNINHMIPEHNDALRLSTIVSNLVPVMTGELMEFLQASEELDARKIETLWDMNIKNIDTTIKDIKASLKDAGIENIHINHEMDNVEYELHYRAIQMIDDVYSVIQK